MASLRAYAQLVRLPNVFTALADIFLGAVVAGALPESGFAVSCLLLTSACLYSAGMVWNDFFDLEQDRRERPVRPLPSAQITSRAAAGIGTTLLLLGLGFAVLSGAKRESDSSVVSIFIAVLLVPAIFLYDAWLKRSWAGPLSMGVCRFLNVLLGLSVASEMSWDRDIYVAAIVGVYITGVTWFARTEATRSNRQMLMLAVSVMLLSLLMALPLPLRVNPGLGSLLFPYMLVLLGCVVGFPAQRAIADPSPPRVQLTVKRALLGLIILDTALALPFGGSPALLILLLLPPALWLGRWVYST